MRNGNKASLCSFLMKVIPNLNLRTEMVQVNDGEALLFQIKSVLFTKFTDICKLYEKHLYSKYRYCYVVFDCCGSGPFTKDIQHTNRSGKVLLDITFTSDGKCVKSEDDFWITKTAKPVLLLDWVIIYPKMVSRVLQMLIYNNSKNCFRVSLMRKACCCQCWWCWCFMYTDTSLEESSKYFRTMKSNTDNCQNL